jgi:ParB family chromosome partitioning protein
MLREVTREYREVPLGVIDPPELASRQTMDEGALDELTASIARDGLLQPILIGRRGERYEVVAGHRRYLACKRAGLATVPCVVYASVSAAHEAVKFAENRFREDLNPAEEAIYFAELLEHHAGGDVDRLCELLGEKRTYVEGRLNLLRGDDRVFESLQAGQIGITVANELNRCTEERYRRYLLDSAIRGGATRSVVAGWIQDWQQEQARRAGIQEPEFTPATPAPIPETNYFTCICCGGTENVHLMQAVNVHQHCKLAILDKLLAAYRGEA